MQKIDRDRLDENTGQIECGEEIGTVFLIDKETAITVKHCYLTILNIHGSFYFVLEKQMW